MRVTKGDTRSLDYSSYEVGFVARLSAGVHRVP